MKQVLVLLLLLGLALCNDDRLIHLNCIKCTEANSTNEDCFYLDGGPFDKYEIKVSETKYNYCTSPYVSFNNVTVNFTCDTDNKCNGSCQMRLSSSTTYWCANNSSSTATNTMQNLNLFYSYMKDDPNLDLTYEWCDGVCTGIPLWLIIVIAVAAVIVIAGVAVGIWWWRKKNGGKLPDINTDTAQNLLK